MVANLIECAAARDDGFGPIEGGFGMRPPDTLEGMTLGVDAASDDGNPAWVDEVQRAFGGTGAPVTMSVARFPLLAAELGERSDDMLHQRLVSAAQNYVVIGTKDQQREELARVRAALAWLWVWPYDLDADTYDKGYGKKAGFEGIGARNAWAYNNYSYVDGGGEPLITSPLEPPDEADAALPRPMFDATQERSGRNNRHKYAAALIRVLAAYLGCDLVEERPAEPEAITFVSDDSPTGSPSTGSALEQSVVDTPSRSPRRGWIATSLVASMVVVALVVTGVLTNWFGLSGDAQAESSGATPLPIIEPDEDPIETASWGPQDRTPVSAQSRNSQVTLNSMIDHSEFGDVRNFIRVREAGDTDAFFRRSIAIEEGHEYEFAVAFTNDARPDLVEAASTGTRLRVIFPDVITGSADVTAVLSSDNASPSAVWSSATLIMSDPTLQMALRTTDKLPMINSWGEVHGSTLSEELFADGVVIGCDALDGVLPSRDDCAGYVTFTLRVDQPDFNIIALARVKGTDDPYTTSVVAGVGDVLELYFSYQNKGTNQQDDVSLRVKELPPGLRYIAESSQIMNSTIGGVLEPTIDGVTTVGYNLGSFQPEGHAALIIDVMIDEEILRGRNDPWVVLDRFARVTTNAGYKEASLVLAILDEQ